MTDLQTCFPDLADAEYLGEGDFCVGYAVAGGLVLRVARHERAARSLALEAAVLPRIAGALPLPVPVPRYVAPRAEGCPAAAVHDRVPGAELSREEWEEFPAATRERLAAEVAGFLRALHAIDVERVGGCGVEVVDHVGETRDVLSRARTRLASLLPGGMADRLESALERYLAGGGVWAYRPALLHGDLSPDHVMYGPESARLTGIIDFTDLAVGDPARDFVFIHEDYGPEFLTLALRHYETEPPEALLPRVRVHHVVTHLQWLLGEVVAGHHADVREGVAILVRELETMQDWP